MILTKTPFRVSFFGGGTDYPEWFQENGGAVLGASIGHYCYIHGRILPPFFDYKYRVVWSKIEQVIELNDIEHPVIREALKLMELRYIIMEICLLALDLVLALLFLLVCCICCKF